MFLFLQVLNGNPLLGNVKYNMKDGTQQMGHLVSSLEPTNSDYGISLPAVVENGIFYGTQFHPEKSGKVGSLMIKNFLRVCKK